MKTKKATLALSITAIVVIVIAFVVLGLGLGLTKTIFKEAGRKLPEAFEVTKLEAEPTSENPITITGTVEINRGESKTMNVGFYNKGESTAKQAVFEIVGCLKDNKKIEENLPKIDSISADVGPSEAKGYSIILYEKGLPAGTYICTIGVKCVSDNCPEWVDEEHYYEKKQFFLKVVT